MTRWKEVRHESKKNDAQWCFSGHSRHGAGKKMQQSDIGAIPVGENDRLIGMVTDRDITVRGAMRGKDLDKLTAGDVMTAGVIYCRDSETVDEAARIMESKQVRRLPVIDANKRMVGMISIGDVSHAASQERRRLSRPITPDQKAPGQGSIVTFISSVS